jgi:hypothetical protein
MVQSIKKKSSIIRLFCVVALCLLLCLTSVVFAETTIIFKGLNMQLPFVTGVYQLALGPFQVGSYSIIRVTTFGNSGSGVIHVTLANVSASGESLGALDDITLDFSASATTTATRVYDTPGRMIKIYLQSLNPTYASVIIYGR